MEVEATRMKFNHFCPVMHEKVQNPALTDDQRENNGLKQMNCGGAVGYRANIYPIIENQKIRVPCSPQPRNALPES